MLIADGRWHDENIPTIFMVTGVPIIHGGM